MIFSLRVSLLRWETGTRRQLECCWRQVQTQVSGKLLFGSDRSCTLCQPGVDTDSSKSIRSLTLAVALAKKTAHIVISWLLCSIGNMLFRCNHIANKTPIPSFQHLFPLRTKGDDCKSYFFNCSTHFPLSGTLGSLVGIKVVGGIST